MTLTRPIPQKTRDKFATDPFYARCCIADGDCSGRVQWHHNLTHSGKRTDDEGGILPACEFHHSKATVREIHERFDYVMLSRGFEAINAKYPRGGWEQRYKYLKTKYGDN